MEIHDEKKETLARFIERTLLGWPEGLRVYTIHGRTYACYESDAQWEKHLEKIDRLIKEDMSL